MSDLFGNKFETSRKGIGGHHSAQALKDEWLTPPYILNALGSFDLDPCAPISPPWQMAIKHYTIVDNGLMQPWAGRVWLNPPYGQETGKWLARLAHHGNGVALIFARTETELFFSHAWRKADAMLFLQGRLNFHHVDGRRAEANAGGPSVLIAYGENNANTLRVSKLPGAYVSRDGIEVIT